MEQHEEAQDMNGDDTAPQSGPVLSATGLCKAYRQGTSEITVLDHAQLQVDAGQRVGIVGRSGSGKSTLLHILAGLDTADAGQVLVAGEDMSAADADGRAWIRGRYMGFVYQNHHLLPEFSALENVSMPMRILGAARASAEQDAYALLQDVGLAERVTHRPSQLSGGERQRVAVARALAGNPRVVLADEPTGNLDADNAAAVMRLIASLSAQRGTAFVVVTHDTSTLDLFDRVLLLADGVLTDYASG